MTSDANPLVQKIAVLISIKAKPPTLSWILAMSIGLKSFDYFN